MRFLKIVFTLVCVILLYSCGEVECPKCDGTGKLSRDIDKKCSGVTQCGGEILGRCVSGVIKPVLTCVDIGNKCQGDRMFAEEIGSGGDAYRIRMDMIRKKYCQETVCSICNGTGYNGKVEEKYDDSYCNGTGKVSKFGEMFK